jgi:hypothetical protein
MTIAYVYCGYISGYSCLRLLGDKCVFKRICAFLTNSVFLRLILFERRATFAERGLATSLERVIGWDDYQ